ncbi:unnamed protein product [Didymodactylos carnosus]|uniref:G-protein coupled receptors family 1 profile domain-containing protein n=2 Tax=Didymodactylos carnosus TaxID=1234261 RepID=A0A8S2HPN5_9BILA|nr:unnamed protein product [Didymodactylos carnosus]CAF3653391.1 unnamed protein product [Didymodactylos carnosus]
MSNSTSGNIAGFLAADLIIIIFSIIAIVVALLFIFIVAFNRQTHSVANLLACHSSIAEIMFSLTTLNIAIQMYQKDIASITPMSNSDIAYPSCFFWGWMIYVSATLQDYSYAIQAFYRYMCVVYKSKSFLQSYRLYIVVIAIHWMFAFLTQLPYYVLAQIKYDNFNHLCQVAIRNSGLIMYIDTVVYIFPVSVVVFVYYKLVVYVRTISNQSKLSSVPSIALFQAKRELKMVRRIIVLILILITCGFPYTVFNVIGFVADPPRYHFRVSITFITLSSALVMIAMFLQTRNVKDVLFNFIGYKTNRIQTTTTDTHNNNPHPISMINTDQK